MSEQSKRMLRGGARAITGVAIIGVAVAAALALGTGIVPVPAIERGVVSVDVDTSRDAQLSLVCAGAFGVLGADPSRPSVSVPVGETQLVATGGTMSIGELGREEDAGTAPRVLEGPASAPFAVAEQQQLFSDTTRGLVASSCTEPKNEQWIVGGSTSLGVSSTLVVGNPFSVPATVQLTIYDENGRMDPRSTTGVLVPALSQRIVSLNGYAPSSEMLAVRVESVGAAVTAHMSVSHNIDIRSFAVDTITSQLAPQPQLVVPGVTNSNTHDHGPTGQLHEHEDFAVTVRLLAPASSSDDGQATVAALFADGTRESLGVVEYVAGTVAEFIVAEWPEQAQALVVDASSPVVGGVLGSADVPPDHDYAWFAPAPVLPADTAVGLAVVPGGDLVLVNPGSEPAQVELNPADASLDVLTITVPAGAALTVLDDTLAAAGVGAGAGAGAGDAVGADADGPNAAAEAPNAGEAGAGQTGADGSSADGSSADGSSADGSSAADEASARLGAASTLRSNVPISAGVRVLFGPNIAGYPVLAPPERQTTLRVYTR